MSPPVYNALAAGKAGIPNQPVVQKAAPLAPAPKNGAAPVKGPAFNSKPDKSVNQGASPAMLGDRQKIARPAAPQIAGTTQARPQDQRSGMETAMGALADQLHKPRTR